MKICTWRSAASLSAAIPSLDTLDLEKENRHTPERVGRYRRYYFVRRSIGTLREFAEALRLIRDDPYLQLNVTRFDTDAKGTWDNALVFFEENDRRLKAIRNDIGGHFGHEAALNAIDKLRPDTVRLRQQSSIRPI